jgi:uncharacterized repeat protein (TIGR01451 family)
MSDVRIRTAVVLGALVGALTLAPAAQAASPRPAVAQAPGAGLSVQLGVTDHSPHSGETVTYLVRVTNGATTAARNVNVELTLAPSFVHRLTTPPAPGCLPGPGLYAVTCPLGTLPGGASSDVYLSGTYGNDGTVTLTATARGAAGAAQAGPGATASLTIEVEKESDGDDGGDDGRRKKGGGDDDDGGGGGGCLGGTLVLSGGTSFNDAISVDDDLELQLNGTTFFNNNDGMASDLPPIFFVADRGDQLRVIARNSQFFGEGPVSIDPLYLFCAQTGERQTLDRTGVPGSTAAAGVIFYDRNFTIGFNATSLTFGTRGAAKTDCSSEDDSTGDGSIDGDADDPLDEGCSGEEDSSGDDDGSGEDEGSTEGDPTGGGESEGSSGEEGSDGDGSTDGEGDGSSGDAGEPADGA